MNDRYELGERRGAGIYGEVYSARDTELARPVAVKFLRFTGARREHVVAHARALTCVSHRNVVGVYDVATIVDPVSGVPTDALVMELVEGATLDVVLRRALTRDDARRIGAGILAAVMAYHERDLAHGDLHERNVMVGAAVKVLDALHLDTRALASGGLAEQQERDRRDVAYLAEKLLVAAGVLGVDVQPASLDTIRDIFEAALSTVEMAPFETGKLTAYVHGDLSSAKAEEWQRRYPEVVLASAARWGLDRRAWPPVEACMSADRDAPAADWLVGATLDELDAKLTAPPLALANWDGAPLAPGAQLHGRLTPPDDPVAPEQFRRSDDARTSRPAFRDPLVEAAMAAADEAMRGRARSGVLIEGAPGSGKSVLSRQLEHKFTRGALSALGHGVRRTARDLAIDLADGMGTWSAVLAIREPTRRELFAKLEAVGRLVPIVDGIDEVSPARARAIADWLRFSRGWWIATSRPLRGLGSPLPPAHKLGIDSLGPSDAERLLVALGRNDLAKALRQTRGGALDVRLVEHLGSTPLEISLLASIVPVGQDLDQFRPDTLYERAFAALLDHACRSGRVRGDETMLMRRLLASVIGELALLWLQAADGVLSASALDEVLDASGLSPTEQVRVTEALQFGHLLVPVAASWEFAHRTIAEWAAAAALRRRVDRALRSTAETREARAHAELAVLAPFLDENVLPAQSRWATLLQFYAPLAREPLALLDRLLGPGAVARWRHPLRSRGDERDGAETRAASSTEVLASWSYVYGIMRLCTWRAAEARTAWAIGVRRWLVSGYGKEQRHRQNLAPLRAFAESVHAHLPRSIEGLVRLAARTPTQEAELVADPLVLLAAMPTTCAPALADALARGTPAEQLAVIEWHLDRNVEPPRAELERLTEELPEALEAASPPASARSADDDTKVEWAPRHGLERLEVAAWSALLAYGHEPPWDTLRRRFTEWPRHLDEVLKRWFTLAPGRAASECAPRRRALLAWLLDGSANEEQAIVAELARIVDPVARAGIVGRVRYWFDDVEDSRVQSLIDALVAAQGWPRVEGRRQPLDGPDRDAHERVARAVRLRAAALSALRLRVEQLVAALGEESMDAIVGELWASLPPEVASRRELLRALGRSKALPRAIAPTDYLLEHGVERWVLERMAWSPEQLAQLEDVGRTGRGRDRYVAVVAMARATGTDPLDALEARFPTDDAAFADLVYAHRSLHRSVDYARLPASTLDPARLPLSERAALGTPGWRDELLAGIAQDKPTDRVTLIELACLHQVREALPHMVAMLENAERDDQWLIERVALLAADHDERSARAAMRHALRFGWPEWSDAAAASLARFVRREDLELLASGLVSAHMHPTLRAAIRALGPDAITDLIALHASSPSDALAETILSCIEPHHVSFAELVSFVLEFLGGDVHRVYGIPGQLGSAYDEPADLDWHSNHVNGALVEAATDALTDAVQHHPDDWQQLRRLLRHPSELLRQRVFELCSHHCAPHELAPLALEALEGSVVEDQTVWEGQTIGLALASVSRGAGSVSVHVPGTGSRVIEALWTKLTVGHRDLILDLTRHPVAPLRELAAMWIGARGTPDWLPGVAPLLADRDPRVMAAAVAAIGRLSPDDLDPMLANVEGRAWTARHDEMLFAVLRPQAGLKFGRELRHRAEPGVAAHVSEATLVRLLSTAADRAACADSNDADAEQARDRCFARFPSLVDQLLEARPHAFGALGAALLAMWTRHPSQPIRAVARRQLAERAPARSK